MIVRLPHVSLTAGKGIHCLVRGGQRNLRLESFLRNNDAGSLDAYCGNLVLKTSKFSQARVEVHHQYEHQADNEEYAQTTEIDFEGANFHNFILPLAWEGRVC